MKFYRSNMQTEGGVRTSYFKSGQSTEYRVRQTPDTIFSFVGGYKNLNKAGVMNIRDWWCGGVVVGWWCGIPVSPFCPGRQSDPGTPRCHGTPWFPVVLVLPGSPFGPAESSRSSLSEPESLTKCG
jgi:hypothetical protein